VPLALHRPWNTLGLYVASHAPILRQASAFPVSAAAVPQFTPGPERNRECAMTSLFIMLILPAVCSIGVLSLGSLCVRKLDSLNAAHNTRAASWRMDADLSVKEEAALSLN